MSSIFRLRRNKKGQAVVELALVLPVLLLLLLGIIEFSLVMNQYLVLASAAREGARTAALGGTDTEIRAIVSSAASTINKGSLATTITPTTRVPGSSVTVVSTNPYTINTPIISVFFPTNPVIISGTAVMRVE